MAFVSGLQCRQEPVKALQVCRVRRDLLQLDQAMVVVKVLESWFG